MQCKTCGAELPENANFCNGCGTRRATEGVKPGAAPRSEERARPLPGSSIKSIVKVLSI